MGETVRSVVRHTFRARPERVFDSFFDPAIVKHWLFATTDAGLKAVHVDLRVGGQYVLIDERDGRDVVNTGAFYDLTRPSRIEFSVYSPDYSQFTVRVVVTIAPAGSGSDVHLVSEIGADQLHLADALNQGWLEMLEIYDQKLRA
jgi:uncharacterized protein YndB with AHSA1/START domain